MRLELLESLAIDHAQGNARDVLLAELETLRAILINLADVHLIESLHDIDNLPVLNDPVPPARSAVTATTPATPVSSPAPAPAKSGENPFLPQSLLDELAHSREQTSKVLASAYQELNRKPGSLRVVAKGSRHRHDTHNGQPSLFDDPVDAHRSVDNLDQPDDPPLHQQPLNEQQRRHIQQGLNQHGDNVIASLIARTLPELRETLRHELLREKERLIRQMLD